MLEKILILIISIFLLPGTFFVDLGDRRRLLLRGLTDSLPEIFPLLYSVSFWLGLLV